jgi:hypothetical protein
LTVDRAYIEAGFKAGRGNACTLRAKQHITGRVNELLTARQRKSDESSITLADVIAELDKAVATAERGGQAGALVSAATLRARLAGLLVDRHEIGDPGSFQSCTTPEAVLQKLFTDIGPREMIELCDVIKAHAEQELAQRAKPIERLDDGWRDRQRDRRTAAIVQTADRG